MKEPGQRTSHNVTSPHRRITHIESFWAPSPATRVASLGMGTSQLRHGISEIADNFPVCLVTQIPAQPSSSTGHFISPTTRSCPSNPAPRVTHAVRFPFGIRTRADLLNDETRDRGLLGPSFYPNFYEPTGRPRPGHHSMSRYRPTAPTERPQTVLAGPAIRVYASLLIRGSGVRIPPGAL
jgi:hypothetical protein